jgi:hypothetical protein
MQRQRQRAQTLRVWGQGQRHHHAASLQGRTVRRPHRSAPRQPIHTLATVIPAMEAMIGNTIERAITDAEYRGHNAPPDYKFKVYTAGRKRRITPQIKRDMKRRAAVEPVIGHLKAEHRMGRNTSLTAPATLAMPCSPPSAITSASCSTG